nr:MAG TPA: hypothetical protein [Caudoviricetes sp.]
MRENGKSNGELTPDGKRGDRRGERRHKQGRPARGRGAQIKAAGG